MNKATLAFSTCLLCLGAPAIAQTQRVTQPGSVACAPGGAKERVTALRTMLLDAKTPRLEQETALDALSRCGEDSVPTLLEFTAKVKSDRSWDRPIAKSMSAILDRRLVPKLIAIAQDSSDPTAQELALSGLISYITCTAITRNFHSQGSVGSSSVISRSTLDTVHHYGIKLTAEDWSLIRGAGLRIRSSAIVDSRVKALAEGLLSTIARRKHALQPTPVVAPTRVSPALGNNEQ